MHDRPSFVSLLGWATAPKNQVAVRYCVDLVAFAVCNLGTPEHFGGSLASK
jgi:hypothetical protein